MGTDDLETSDPSGGGGKVKAGSRFKASAADAEGAVADSRLARIGAEKERVALSVAGDGENSTMDVVGAGAGIGPDFESVDGDDAVFLLDESHVAISISDTAGHRGIGIRGEGGVASDLESAISIGADADALDVVRSRHPDIGGGVAHRDIPSPRVGTAAPIATSRPFSAGDAGVGEIRREEAGASKGEGD